MDTHNNYVCVAGDIVNSRSFYSEPFLEEIIDHLNKKYQDSIITPFAIRLGDEIIGILDKFSNGYLVLLDLYSIMKKHNKAMYVGIGFGTIDNILSENIHMVNGSAIRSAVTARDQFIKKRHPDSARMNRHSKYIKFYTYSENMTFPYKSINDSIYFIHEKLEHRTKKQNEVIELLESAGNLLTYKEIAAKIGTESEASVSKLLSRANYETVKNAQRNLCSLLDFLQQIILSGETLL